MTRLPESTISRTEIILSQVPALADELDRLPGQRATLHYSSADEPGIRRLPWGKGFTYRDPAGDTVRDKVVRERVNLLAIPPGWTDVWICLSPSGHLQATGRDDRGRKQYRYHPAWHTLRDRKKFAELLPFANQLSNLRRAVTRDLERGDLSRERITAAAVRLLETSCLRVGNESYRRENGTFGLTTLRRRHVAMKGSHLRFQFVGKGGLKHSIEVDAPQVASAIRSCHDLPGKELWHWRDEDEVHRLTSGCVNDYIRLHTRLDISAKIFRIWMASVHALDYLVHADEPTSQTKAKEQMLAAVDVARDALRNTRAVCRSSYIHPDIERLHMAGELKNVAGYAKTRARKWLDREEVALVHVLEHVSA